MATQTITEADGTEKVKVTFDEAEQARVNELIREAQGRAAKELREELATAKAELGTLRGDLDSAKSALATAKTPGEKKEARADIEALQNQINEMKNASQTTIQQMELLKQQNLAKDQELKSVRDREVNYRKTVTLSTAAQKVNPYSVDQIVKLSSDCVEWSDNKNGFVVVDPATRQERLNASFEPMSLDEFYAEFASKNQNLVKSNVRAGTGSSESSRFDVANNGKYSVEQIFGPKSNSQLANELAKTDIKEYHRLKDIAASSGLIPKR